MASELVRVEKSIYKQLWGIKVATGKTISHLVTQAAIEKYGLVVKKKVKK